MSGAMKGMQGVHVCRDIAVAARTQVSHCKRAQVVVIYLRVTKQSSLIRSK